MTTPIIQLENIATSFGAKKIHQNLYLDIYEGEALGLVGGSGSGKTTLLRAILMLKKCDMGDIKIFGESIFHASEKTKIKIQSLWGVMFQHGALFSSLTVLENVAFPLQEKTMLDLKTIEEIARLKIALVGLPADAAEKYPSEISGGMKKRVAVARAIALDPKILFLDEPSAGLDPQGASDLDDLIVNLKKNLGLTVILITHDLDTLWQVTDRVAFLGEGKVIETAPIGQLYHSQHPLVQKYFSNRRAQKAADTIEKNRYY